MREIHAHQDHYARMLPAIQRRLVDEHLRQGTVGRFRLAFGAGHRIVSNDLAAATTRPITGLDVVLSGFFSSTALWPHQKVTCAMRDKAAQVLELLETTHLGGRLVTEMSSGEARRILIGRALVHDPMALLLDEPSTSLDVFAQRELRRILRELAVSGIGIIMVTHLLADIIPEIQRVVMLKQGRVVVDGGKREVLTGERLGRLFGTPVT
jgi:iron complex transport system ATP-binding protein